MLSSSNDELIVEKENNKRFILENMSKLYTRWNLQPNMNIMQVVQPDAYSKLCQAGTQRETYRAMLQEWYFKRQKLTENMKYEITDWAKLKVIKKLKRHMVSSREAISMYTKKFWMGYLSSSQLETACVNVAKWQLSGDTLWHVIA
ncbi:hypothetical protein Tco_0214564 [Tanacetum coccineum]